MNKRAPLAAGEPRVNTLEVTVEELREDLKLTAEQEPVWSKRWPSRRRCSTRSSRRSSSRPRIHG
jgi:hypothetical protein